MADLALGYHVRYVRHLVERGGDACNLPDHVEGTITLFGLHPLVWANTPPASYRKFFWSEIISWQEFEDADGSIRASFDGAGLECEEATKPGPDKENDG